MNKSAPKTGRWALVLVPVVLIAALAGFLLGDRQTPADTRAGIEYLEGLEQKDPDTVMQVLRDRRQAALDAQREELLRQVREGELDPFTLFQDAVIMGDSRAVGFWYYGYVDESRTLTGAGHTILDIHNQLDVLEAMNPTYVYLCYGLNDLKIGYWGNVDRFVSKYMEYIDEIRQRMPGTVVIVSSTLPYRGDEEEDSATDPTEETRSEEEKELARLSQIPEWNEALARACAEHDVIFVDNSQISEEYKNLWEPDGIHVKKSFYPHWARNLIIAALEEGGTQVE